MNKKYNFKNLVFEGGGIKATAYIGALKVLEQKGIIENIERVAGTSAGAIIAALLSIGYNYEEINNLFLKTDFSLFKDDSSFFLLNFLRLFNRYGWYKGKAFKKWLENAISQKADKNITFKQLVDSGKKHLHVVGTDVNSKQSIVFSHETHPDMKIVDAVRVSMSIPLVFKAVFNEKSVFVDGGIYYNYPINLFDRRRYIFGSGMQAIYNKETLGLRVDTSEEISESKKKNSKKVVQIFSLKDYLIALIAGLTELANKIHLKEQDWHRTIYINSLGVETTDFNISRNVKSELIESGKNCALEYFKWFDNPPKKEKPINK